MLQWVQLPDLHYMFDPYCALDLSCLNPLPEFPVQHGDLGLHNFQRTYGEIQISAMI